MSMATMMTSSLHPTTTANKPSSSSSSPHLLLPKTSHSTQNAQRRRLTSQRGWRLGSLSIRSSSEKSGEESPLLKLDRRNMLIGLGGGLYGAAAGLGLDQNAMADPLGPPDLSKCGLATSSNICYQCCPPYPDPPKLADIPSYKIPTVATRTRVAAQDMTTDQLAKFQKAITAMKNLDPSDPWNFMQQAQIHCAYCNGAYDQVGFDIPLQVHFSWIFLPWHRWYLYFYEKILGKLIDDPTFALPYWNYDNPLGMKFPKIYSDCATTLFTPLRNQTNAQPDKYLDLFYSSDASYVPPAEDVLIQQNLGYFRKIFNESQGLPEAFIGDSLAAGEQATGASSGSLENLHNVVHIWTGSSVAPNFDMGNFVSAARDPVFFGHHANVDRLWQIYRTQFMKPPIESDSTDFLNATFIFYDENKQIVKVNVKDSLDTAKLGYTYADMTPLWKEAKASITSTSTAKTRSAGSSRVPVAEFGPAERSLDEAPIRVLVKRPSSSRSQSEIEDNVEVLIIDGIEFDHSSPARFDVFITKPSGKFVGPSLGEFAGSFVTAAHGHRHAEGQKKEKRVSLKMGITELIKELNAEDSENLVVTFVPRLGPVTIGGVHIDHVKFKSK